MARPRRGKGVEHRVDRTCRVGRTRDDYLKFVAEHPGVRVVEMDTVEGARGGKALPALLFNPFNFMPAFPVDAKTSECVLGVFAAIVAALFGISRIAANDVTLKPSLLGIEVKVRESVSRKDCETPAKR